MTPRLRILFVDDEAAILDGLRRLLRPLRDEWEVFSALGGEQALAVLANETMDVVVSDMRMPGMDGAQLLNLVREQHPRAVRIVLSGQSDQESLLRMIGPVHQYLSKPCDLALLRMAVSRSCALRTAINDPAVCTLIAGMTSLPTLPELYRKLITCLRSSDPPLSRLGEIVAQDLGMSVRVLQLVNSAMFGVSRPITSPVEAVALLGVETVQMMAMTLEILDHSTRAETGGVHPEGLWQHSLLVAHLAKAIATAERQPLDVCTAAFSAGLMHDCGQLVLAHHLPEQYRAIMTGEARDPATRESAERRAIGASHANVGGYLLSLWGLPDELIEAVVFHHRPSACPAAGFTPLTAVHIAEAFAPCGTLAAAILDQPLLDHDYIARLGLSQQIGAWTALAGSMRTRGLDP